MADSTNNNTGNNSNNNTQVQPAPASTWVTVNTSTTENVTRMEISKSDDYDRIVKETKLAR